MKAVLQVNSKHKMTIVMSERIFNNTPALIISLRRMCPLAKSIAFGGVDTGIENAQLAAKVTGKLSTNGL